MRSRSYQTYITHLVLRYETTFTHYEDDKWKKDCASIVAEYDDWTSTSEISHGIRFYLISQILPDFTNGPSDERH